MLSRPTQTALPTYLITGLLGSGKTSCLAQLLEQKNRADTVNENWLILINEFGKVDIDSALIESLSESDSKIVVKEVSGGCICCTAQVNLINTLNKTLQQHPNINRIFIEPTGLGHPAKILDALHSNSFIKPVKLMKSICLITAQQLTRERWEKSVVMRDLVNLADTIVINKTDLSSSAQHAAALELLADCYPPKTDIIETQQAKIALSELLQPGPPKPFTILQKRPNPTTDTHAHLTEHEQTPYESKIDGVQSCFISQNTTETTVELQSMGWTWDNRTQFNRIKLKQFFAAIAPNLLRAKGILKTGNEWQLVQWSDQQLSFSDIAWRADSRLECIFQLNNTEISSQQLEQMLQQTIHDSTKQNAD